MKFQMPQNYGMGYTMPPQVNIPPSNYKQMPWVKQGHTETNETISPATVKKNKKKKKVQNEPLNNQIDITKILFEENGE